MIYILATYSDGYADSRLVEGYAFPDNTTKEEYEKYIENRFDEYFEDNSGDVYRYMNDECLTHDEAIDAYSDNSYVDYTQMWEHEPDFNKYYWERVEV